MHILTPQRLTAALLEMNEEQGRHILQVQVPLFSEAALDRLVFFLKREADRHWNHHAQRSFVLAGYLLLIADLTRNVYYRGLGLMARGDALRRLDRDQEALPFFDAAGDEFLSIGDEVSWARTRIGRVSACQRLNRPTEALRDAQAARDIFIRYDKLRRAGQIDVNAAIIHFELGQYEQALHLFDRALATYLRHGEGVELHVARARGNKALTLAAQGKFREAVLLHSEARATFASYGEREEIAVAREDLNIADIYAAQGHYSQALWLYNQSRTRFERHEMPFAMAEAAQQLCFCLVRLNRVREAYTLAGETVAFFRTAPGQRHNLARSLMHQADAAQLLLNYPEADTLLLEASSLLEAGGFVRLAALARLRRAELYLAMGQFTASLREAEYVADVFAEQEDLPHLARTMLLQARLAFVHADARSAHELCTHALDIALGQELLDLTYRCYDLLGQLSEQIGDLDAASASYDRAVRCLDEVQSRLVLDERTSFLEDKGGIYQRAILLAIKRNLHEQAFVYVEKAKSRVLGDYLRNNIDIRVRTDAANADALLDDLTRLREEQAWFSSIVYHTENEAALSDTAIMRMRAFSPLQARLEMQRRERRIEQLFEQLRLRSISDLVVRPPSAWSDTLVSTLCSHLTSHELLLEYYLTDQDLYIFQLTHAGLKLHTLSGVVPRLERLLALWRTNLDLAGGASGGPDREQNFHGLLANVQGLLRRLYDLLLAPVTQALYACQHLLIVPYGLLHYLPFHCLYDGTYFAVEHWSISYLPAAALFDICRQRGEHIQDAGVDLRRALIFGLSEAGQLPYASQEAALVAQQLAVSPALDAAATTSLLWQHAQQSPLIHIAAHGLFRLDAPNFSYIKFADRQLSTIEVFNLNLAACSLVVLSACETGRAVIAGVDEVIGLGRGFLYAGAASLLPTFWKVDDASSAELMATFYQALLRGHAKAAALAGAQRTFLARARASTQLSLTHPYFWAAFHLIGDAGPLVAPTQS